jgi:hypothetical protein
LSDDLEAAIAGIEDYLRRYPSGHFSEIAQSQLDRLLAKRGEKKLTIASQQGNPYSRGTAYADLDYRVGDRYVYRKTDEQTGLERRRPLVVTAVSQFEVVFNEGKLVTDRLGNVRRRPDGVRLVDAQTFPAEYAVGRKWVSRLSFVNARGRDDTAEVAFAIVERRPIEVAAGRFDAFHAEGSGWAQLSGRREFTYWIAPDVSRKHLLMEMRWSDRAGRPQRRTRDELATFTQAVAPSR